MNQKTAPTEGQNSEQTASLATSDGAACSALAARIPFCMLAHMSGETCHSGRYTNEKLKIGYEYHHPAKHGFVKTGPKVKVGKCFYREEPIDSPCYPTLRELLEADDDLRARAEAEYPPKIP